MRDRPSRLTTRTARVGILGWPVGHSRSPAMHNDVHRALGIDAHYHRLAVRPERLAAAVEGLRQLGWLGCNVTIPHKVEAARLADELTDEARLVGAVNVLHLRGDVLLGDNTDARGFVDALVEATEDDLKGTALVVGTGGAARAVVVGLARAGAHVIVAGRRPEAADELASLAAEAGAPSSRGIDLASGPALAAARDEARLVVNATSLGMRGEALAEPLHRLAREHLACDLVYEPEVTTFLADARSVGALAVGGMGMLVHQAALGFARWHACAPPVREFWQAVRPT